MGVTVFIILLAVKYLDIPYVYNNPELSWGWVLMPIVAEVWSGLNKPNNQ